MQNFTDSRLRELAHKRVEFKAHLFVYCVVNGVLWTIWFFTNRAFPWPIWPTAGWGIGLIFHYMFEYRSSKFFSEEEEYKKLKSEMDKKKP